MHSRIIILICAYKNNSNIFHGFSQTSKFVKIHVSLKCFWNNTFLWEMISNIIDKHTLFLTFIRCCFEEFYEVIVVHCGTFLIQFFFVLADDFFLRWSITSHQIFMYYMNKVIYFSRFGKVPKCLLFLLNFVGLLISKIFSFFCTALEFREVLSNKSFFYNIIIFTTFEENEKLYAAWLVWTSWENL